MILNMFSAIKGFFIGRITVVCDILRHPLNRGSRGRALFDYILWNCARFSLDCSHIIKISDNLEIILRKQENYGSAVYVHGLSDFDELLFLAHALRPGDLFIDVGGNVGLYSLWVSKITGANSIVLEPVPSTFEVLEKNIRLNNLCDLISAKKIAVGAEPGLACMTADKGGQDHIVLAGESNQLIKVSVDTLDRIAAELSPVAIKIDVEGFELNVLTGADKVLSHRSLCAIIIEIQDWTLRNFGVQESNIRSILLSYGFVAHTYDPVSRSLFRSEKNKGLNQIFVRHTPELAQRLKTAARVKTLLMSDAV